MARIVGYIASSLDGFIATHSGGIDWLTKDRGDTGEAGDHGYGEFIKTIGTVVMGRATYDWIVEHSDAWPYPGKRNIVVTSRPIENPKAEILIRPDVAALIGELRAFEDGNVWMLGGGQLQMAFIERGGLDSIEIFIAPEIIGGGIPLFPPTGFEKTVKLLSATSVGGVFVRLEYGFAD